MKSVTLAAVIALVFTATGCSTLTPASFRAKAPDISTKWSGPVAVTGIHKSDPASRFNANGMEFDVDLDVFSDHLAELVRTSLRESGVEIAPGGKNLRLEVVLLDFMYRGPCLVDYTVELGDAERFGLQSTGESSNFQVACRRALQSVVLQLLNDPRTSRYMGSE